jgi:hypothetical protein
MKFKSWRTIGLSFFAALLVVALLMVSFQIDITPKNSNSKVCITIGNRSVVEASGLTAPDYYTTGVNDNIPFQQALNALPAVGGELMVLSGTYNFAATVTRAIANVTIVGTGAGSYFTYDGATPIFTAGGNNWKFENLRTDTGSISMGATTGWIWENVTIGVTYYTYLTDSTGNFDSGTVTGDTLVTDDLDAPTGRTASIFIATTDATHGGALASSPQEIKQADVVCNGTADDVEIISAMTSLLPMGGIVQLGTGRFYTTHTLDMALDEAGTWKCIWLKGSGIYATEIYLESGSNCDVISMIATDAAKPIGFKYVTDLKINCNKAGQSTGNWDGIEYGLVAPGDIYDAYFERLIILNAKRDGFHITDAWGVHINDCYVEYAGQDGLYMQGDASYVNGCYLSYNGRHGMYLDFTSTHFDVSDCTMVSNLNYGLENAAGDSTFSNLNFATGWGTDRYAVHTTGSRCNWTNLNINGWNDVSTAKGLYIYGDNSVYTNIVINGMLTSSIVLETTAERNTIVGGNVNIPVSDTGINNTIVLIKGSIAPGEIRTFSGTIATLTQNAFNSVDNPFGQAVRVLDLQIYVSTAATATTPNLDCGIGSSATTDYTTLFDDLPGETIGYYKSTITTPGAQTVPQLWASGSGNRYLNMSIKDAAATGMVATYTVTVMGN